MDWLGKFGQGAIFGFLEPLLSESSFLSLRPMLVALAIALVVIAVRILRKRRPLRFRRLLRLLFPSRIFLHPSATTDYKLFLINNGLLFFVTLAAVMTPALVSEGILHSAAAIGFTAAASEGAGGAERVLFTVTLVLAWDFAATFAHYLKHHVPALWEFHKVHHSAEVMTPVTAVRRHPVDDLFGAFVTTLVLGLTLAAWYLVMGTGIRSVTVFGTWAGIYVWRLLGYNLRHSHIWISYGDTWNRIFISPAQHQIHHSNDPQHFDKNFGHIFAFWDTLFGSLYLPRPGERVKFGIEPADMPQFQTLGGIYLTPFAKAARGLIGRLAAPIRQD